MTGWVRSSFCDSSACIEVGIVGENVVMRGGIPIVEMTTLSREGNAKVLGQAFTPAEWAAFVEGVKAGEFDNLENQDA